MIVVVTYLEGAPELYKTSDEPGVGSDIFRQVYGGNSMAVLYKPRLDLLETEGLRIDIWWYSADVDEGTRKTLVNEFGKKEVYNLNLQVGKVWHILGPEDMPAVESINIDNRWFVNRRGGVLVSETLFKQKLRHYCGARMEEAAWSDQVVALHETIRAQHPDWDDGRIANSYGYPKSAWAEAASGERNANVLDDGHKTKTNYTEMVKQARREHPTFSKLAVFNLLNAEGTVIDLKDMNETWAEASHEIGLSDDEDGQVPDIDFDEDGEYEHEAMPDWLRYAEDLDFDEARELMRTPSNG